MPKFLCNRCCAPLDTGDAFAPTQLTCPECSGVVSTAPKDLPPMPLFGDEQAPVTPPLEVPPPQPAADPCRAPAETPEPHTKSWKPLVRRVVAATLVGGTLTFASMYFTLWNAEGDHPDHLLGGWLGANMMIAGVGISFGLITALIMLAFKKPFGRSFANAYSLSVLVAALLSAMVGFVSAEVNRRQQALQKEAMEDPKSKFDGIQEDLEK